MKNKKKSTPRTGKVPKARTAQESIPFREWFDDNLFRLDETTYAVICEFTNAGYLSKTESEQERKYYAYRKALSELPPNIHYQEIIYNQPINSADYVAAVAGKTGEFRDEYEKSFFDVQRKFATEGVREIAQKRYLAAFSVSAKNKEHPVNALYDAVSMFSEQFRAMGSTLSMLSPDDVFAELYRFYNPFGGSMPELPPDLYRKGLTVKDFIAPDGIDNKWDYCRLGDAYCRILSIHSYGSEIVDTLIYSLLNNDLSVYVSKHVEHIPKESAVRQIERKLNRLEEDKQSRLLRNNQKGTDYVPLNLKRSIEGCNALLDAFANNEEFLRQTVYIMLAEKSVDALDLKTKQLVSVATSARCTLRPVSLYVESAFQSVLPLGKNHLERHQYLLASEAAVATPFSYESYFDSNGFYYGRNEHNGEPVIRNRKKDKSGHGFIFGTTGSGKGMFAKHEISNILYQPFCRDDDVVIVDATGEYLPIAKVFGGNIVDLAPTGDTHINPLHISKEQERLLGRPAAVASKISHMIAFLSQIKQGEGLTATEKSLVDDYVSRTLKKHSYPTLNTFYSDLIQDTSLDAQGMCNYLSRYVQGSITLFSGRDSEPPEQSRLTVYSLRSLSGDLRDCAMLAMLDRIEEQIMRNYERGRWTWVYIDEMHRYFDSERNPFAAERFARLYSESRKWGAILTGITQLPKPVIASKDGSTMLSLSRFIVMAELDATNAEAATTMFDLNEAQQRTLKAPDIGQYVIRTQNAPMSVRMIYPGAKATDKNLMYDLFSTNFSETEDENTYGEP